MGRFSALLILSGLLSCQPILVAGSGVDAPRRYAVLEARRDISFCFGRNSICAKSNDLYDDCYTETGGRGKNETGWWDCTCGNGYVSVDQACFWCQEVYDLDPIDVQEIHTSGCSSVGATIAPIPSSILSLESKYNASYTGIISGGGGGGGGAAKTTSGDTAPETTKATAATRTRTTAGDDTTITQGPQTFTIISGDEPTTQSTITVTRGPVSGGDTPGGPNAAAGLDLRSATVAAFVVFAIGTGFSLL